MEVTDTGCCFFWPVTSALLSRDGTSKANKETGVPASRLAPSTATEWLRCYTAPRPVACLPENGTTVVHKLLKGPVRSRSAGPGW